MSLIVFFIISCLQFNNLLVKYFVIRNGNDSIQAAYGNIRTLPDTGAIWQPEAEPAAMSFFAGNKDKPFLLFIVMAKQ
jgi:hypothetical protein